MAKQIVECIPNFSEGRNKQVVDAIVAAIQSVEGILLLDRSSDPDHNRSVVTFVGDLNNVGEAAFRGIAKAAELIDMEKHSGEHPRMGATDVVPFVPISGVNMDDCVGIAKQLGKRAGEELDIPVYLYENAASKISRRNLAKLRSGEYEGIKAEISKVARRAPDFGPKQLGSAGAVAIGARQPLIAYNVYLNTDKVEIAQAIARSVRHLSGGYRFVKGAGFLVEGQAQVSMNLTDFTKTPVARVVEAIRTEAARYGLAIEKSELIGLIPQAALADAAAWYLQLHEFDPDQILENRIASLQSAGTRQELGAFLNDLASSEPAPGGGSAAAHAGALAAALVAMVGRVSVGKPKYKDIEAEMADVIAAADVLRSRFSDAVQRDAASFEAVIAAFKLPKSNQTEKKARAKAIEDATLGAVAVPLEVVQMALDTLKLVVPVAEKGNQNAITDAGTAAALANAAMQGAAMNARINLASLGKSEQGVAIEQQLAQILKEAAEQKKLVDGWVAQRGNIGVG